MAARYGTQSSSTADTAQTTANTAIARSETLGNATAPVPAAKKALEKAGLTKDDIDVWEINEVFAVVAEKFIRHLDLPREKVSIHGGAMALDHPIGATG